MTEHVTWFLNVKCMLSSGRTRTPPPLADLTMTRWLPFSLKRLEESLALMVFGSSTSNVPKPTLWKVL